MKTIRTQKLIAAGLVGALAFTTTQAQQYPNPTTAAKVPGPAPGTAMTTAYVQTVGRMAYLWGWPLVNMANRGIAFSKAPERSEERRVGKECRTRWSQDHST